MALECLAAWVAERILPSVRDPCARAYDVTMQRNAYLHAIVDCIFSNQYFFGQREADERGLRGGLSIGQQLKLAPTVKPSVRL